MTLCDPVDYSTPGFPVVHYFPECAQTHFHWVGDAIQPSYLYCSLFLLPLIFPSIRVFSSELALCLRWQNYWNFSFSISPSDEYSGLIFFRIDWFELLAVQGTHKSLLQHYSSKASILGHSAFFMVQLSHLYMTTGKTICVSVTYSHLTLWDPTDCIMPGFPVLHYLLEFSQIHVHWVGDVN